MAYDYDTLYGETPRALGAPTQVFVDFFDRFGRTGMQVLDLGCGQGRDALFIARQGHDVTGVDLSPNGICDLRAAALQEDLPVIGVVADITTYQPGDSFDVIVIDRTLHMLPEAPRLAVLRRMLDHVAGKGWLLIADEPSNIPAFTSIIAAHGQVWRPEIAKRGLLFLQRC